MNYIQALIEEIKMESVVTAKMLERVPEDKYDWKPHQKSMSLIALATHLADICSWPELMIDSPELDFAKMDFNPTPIANASELMQKFNTSLATGLKALEKANDKIMADTWTMRHGERIIETISKWEAIRHSVSQTIHHRAQLGVYLRLLDIPIPGTYGPSADDTSF
ncbi:MAG TPA: DinB family protein [Bacteroidia bacterium]